MKRGRILDALDHQLRAAAARVSERCPWCGDRREMGRETCFEHRDVEEEFARLAPEPAHPTDARAIFRAKTTRERT